MRRKQVALGDVRVGAGLRLNGDLFRIVQVVARNLADRVRHRRREQRNLLLIRGVLEDALDILLEAHVQHLVCLVKHKEAQVGDVQRALLQVVDDATRRTDDHLCATAQPRELNAVGLAAVDRQHVDAAQVIGKRLEGVRHLQCQLTRRGEHKCLRVTLLGINLGQHRQRECCGLTRTRLCQADDVAAFHQQRDGLCLNRRGLLETDALDGLHNLVWQAEGFKAVLRLYLFCLFLCGICSVIAVVGLFVRIRDLYHVVFNFNGRFFLCGAGYLRNLRIPGVLYYGLNNLGRDILRVFLIFRHIHIRLVLAAGGVFGNAHRLPTLRHYPLNLLFQRFLKNQTRFFSAII